MRTAPQLFSALVISSLKQSQMDSPFITCSGLASESLESVHMYASIQRPMWAPWPCFGVGLALTKDLLRSLPTCEPSYNSVFLSRLQERVSVLPCVLCVHIRMYVMFTTAKQS